MRARRRQDRSRMVAKATRVVRGWYPRPDVHAVARKLADNLAVCSCPLCRVEKHNQIPRISEQRRRATGHDDN